MADQGKWFKLHVGWDDDPDISSMSLDNQARWCKFGTYVKEHGTYGTVKLVSPCKTLQHRFEVGSFEAVINVLKMFPNLHIGEEQKSTVSLGTFVIVSFLNWHQYQGDLSSGRVRKFRARETAKRRGEEKRRDEKRKEENKPPIDPPTASSKFLKPTAQEVTAYAKSIGFEVNGQYFLDRNDAAGWVWGRARHPIKDWRAVVRTWKVLTAKFKREDSPYGADDSKSPVSYATIARAKREAEAIRKDTAAGAVPPGVRDLPHVQTETESSLRGGHRDAGNNGAAIQPENPVEVKQAGRVAS